MDYTTLGQQLKAENPGKYDSFDDSDLGSQYASQNPQYAPPPSVQAPDTQAHYTGDFNAQSSGLGGFSGADNSKNFGAANPVATAQPQQNQPGGFAQLWHNITQPYTLDQANADNIQRGSDSYLKTVGETFLNAGRGALSTVGGIGQAGVLGIGGLAEGAYDGITGQDHSKVWDGEKFVRALPGAVVQGARGLGDFAKEVVSDPSSAAYDATNFLYSNPINALLAASGVGDGVAAAGKIGSSLADSAALSAAVKSAGLTGDAAASATLGASSPLGSILGNISKGAQATGTYLNPLSTGLDALTAGKDALGALTSRGAGLATMTGKEGTQALRNIASGGDIGSSAMGGVRGAATTDEQQAFRDAIGGINQHNIDNGNAGLVDTTPLFSQLPDIMGKENLGISVMTPEEQTTVSQYLANRQNGLSTSASTPGYGTQDIGLNQQAKQIFDNYWPNATAQNGDQIRNILYGNKYKLGPDGATSDQMDGILGTALKNNGYVGINPGITKLSDAGMQKVLPLVQTIYKLGSEPGFEPSATNLNTLKEKIQGLYQADSPVAPISNEQKTINSISTSLSHAVSDPLRAVEVNGTKPYQDVMNRYQARYGGQSLSKLTAPGISNLLGKGAIGGEAAAAAALGHFLNPIAGALGAGGAVLTSPRLAAEAANLYGKTARGYGAVTAPLKSSVQNGALMNLLNSLGVSGD